ncbi:MAG: MotA/TolQ/ExbB proton channel family protein [Candidatus Omnitrophica bacterium]|nr:MotA/TolQ/ExbB proton channel family protein [Candidatus Omnitrophota bacterium]
MLSYIVKGGPVMIPIILGSILGFAIIIEKAWMFYAMRMDTQAFTGDLLALVKAGKFHAALELCEQNRNNPVALTLKVGIERRGLPVHEVEKALERAGNGQVKHMERYIGGLISIIGIEPLLGFLGTITGLIRAFMAWERAGSSVTVSALAAGMYQAMITTAAGLIVAVPYYLICNFFVSRIKYVSYDLSDSSIQLVEALTEAEKKNVESALIS